MDASILKKEGNFYHHLKYKVVGKDRLITRDSSTFCSFIFPLVDLLYLENCTNRNFIADEMNTYFDFEQV